jgi:hypothetical protein
VLSTPVTLTLAVVADTGAEDTTPPLGRPRFREKIFILMRVVAIRKITIFIYTTMYCVTVVLAHTKRER